MYILKIIYSAFIIAFFIQIVSCKPAGPLTPGETFYKLKKACLTGRTDKIPKYLSEKSLEKIDKIIKNLSSLNNKQLKYFAYTYGLEFERLKYLSADSFIRLYFRSEKNVIVQALKEEIVSISQNINHVSIRVENGMELVFVKEGPYWKLDISDY